MATPAPVPASAKPRPRSAPDPVRRNLPSWVPVAVAASVLLCVTAGSFAFFSGQSSPRTAIAKNPWSNALPAVQDTPRVVPSPTATVSQHTRPDPDAVAKVDVSPVPPVPFPRPVVPEAVAVAPEPRPAQHDLIGSRVLPPLPPFDLVQVRVPFLRTVAELDRDDTRQELADELARDPAFRIDLFVRDTARGVEVFQNAARSARLTVFADAVTIDKLKKKQVASVVIYTEGLTASELTALFAKVSAEDMKFTPRVCDALHATPIVRSDELELKQVLGVDVGLFKRAAGATGSGGTGQGGNREKPVSAETIDSVTATLTSPSAKTGDPTAVLLTWQPTHPMIGRTPPATSAELKQYLAKRGPRKPNAVPVVIVIRHAG
ncbi:MAG: hypothetical protein J0I06_05985 [Planctomycetes bacterium]|nr:hypothetical protein [Planctomycetota bacterium]